LQEENRQAGLQSGRFARYFGSALKNLPMSQAKNRQEARLQNLIASAKQMNILVRTEKLLREAGYRAHSGRCRIKGQEVILLDRDAPIGDQIEFLAGELSQRCKENSAASEPEQTASFV
jgi:hypothetical protein